MKFESIFVRVSGQAEENLENPLWAPGQRPKAYIIIMLQRSAIDGLAQSSAIVSVYHTMAEL